MKQDKTVNCGGDCSEAKNPYVDLVEKKKRNVTKKIDKMNSLCYKIAEGKKISPEQEKSLDDLGETQSQLKIIDEVLTKYKDFEKFDEKDAAKAKKQKAKEEKKIKFEVANEVSTACMILNVVAENKLVQEDIVSESEGPILSKEELDEVVNFVKSENKIKYGIDDSMNIVNFVELSANFGSKVYMMLNESKEKVVNSDITYATLNSHFKKLLDSSYFSSVPHNLSVTQMCGKPEAEKPSETEVVAVDKEPEEVKKNGSKLNLNAKPFEMKTNGKAAAKSPEDKNVENGQGLPRQQSNNWKGKNGKNGSNPNWNGNKGKREQFKGNNAPKANRSNNGGSKPIFQPQKKNQFRNSKQEDAKSKK